MRRLLVVLLVVVVVVACGGSYLSTVTPNAAGAFRRCWPAMEESYCRMRVVNPLDGGCRTSAEKSYAAAQHKARWLVRWGCPAARIQDR